MPHCDDGRPVPRLTDEELEYYGELYLHHRIGDIVTFETFVLDPDNYLHRRARSAGAMASRPNGWWRSLLAFLGFRTLARAPHA